MGSGRDRLLAAAGPAAAAPIGGLSTDPGSAWFRSLDEPPWYPPPQTFGVVWTGLNLLLTTAWTPLFFRAHRPGLATLEAGLLTGSALDLARRAARVHGAAGAVLLPYAAWSAFATAPSASIARRNRAS